MLLLPFYCISLNENMQYYFFHGGICSLFDVIFNRKHEINQILKSLKYTYKRVHFIFPVGPQFYDFEVIFQGFC